MGRVENQPYINHRFSGGLKKRLPLVGASVEEVANIQPNPNLTADIDPDEIRRMLGIDKISVNPTRKGHPRRSH
jgi:hypothetical protein